MAVVIVRVVIEENKNSSRQVREHEDERAMHKKRERERKKRNAGGCASRGFPVQHRRGRERYSFQQWQSYCLRISPRVCFFPERARIHSTFPIKGVSPLCVGSEV